MKSIKISRNLIALPMSDVGEDVSTKHKERERERYAKEVSCKTENFVILVGDRDRRSEMTS
jgi:hypothetical protein